MGDKRGSLEIIYVILIEARTGINKTRLVYKTNLNFRVIQRYLEFLIASGLIRIEYMPHMKYKTTEAGFKYIELFEQIMDILKIDNEIEFELL